MYSLLPEFLHRVVQDSAHLPWCARYTGQIGGTVVDINPKLKNLKALSHKPKSKALDSGFWLQVLWLSRVGLV